MIKLLSSLRDIPTFFYIQNLTDTACYSQMNLNIGRKQVSLKCLLSVCKKKKETKNIKKLKTSSISATITNIHIEKPPSPF